MLVEPIDRNDLDFLGRETDYLCSHGLTDFALATFLIEDRNAELTPWKAAPSLPKCVVCFYRHSLCPALFL